MALINVLPAEQLRGLASRKAKPDDFKSVRHPLVAEEESNGWLQQRRNKSTTRLRKPKTYDKYFTDKIWTLLYRMGFERLSDKGGAFLLVDANDPQVPEHQIDIVALDDEVAFAIDCRSSEKPRKFDDFSKQLAKQIGLRDRFTHAVRTQFPAPNKRPSIFAIWTSNLRLTENEESRAQASNVSLLDERDLEYYEQLVSQVGTAARFQFLADLLQGRSVPGLEITVPAIRSKIAGGIAYSFCVSPEYLLKIAFVSHRAKGKASDIDAYQRLLKKSRLRSIREYIADGGFFPTNIVVNIAEQRWLNFDRGKQQIEDKSSIVGWLHIRPSYRVAWIIDGQHRLFAYANHPLAKKSLISVMAFVGLEASEQARLFVDINAQQRKVKQSLLQELYSELHWDAAEPEVRVQAVLSKAIQVIDSDAKSPFYGRILKADDPRTATRCISFNGVFGAMNKAGFFIEHVRKGTVIEYGPLWDANNEATLKRTVEVLTGYFATIRSEAEALWDLGSAEGGGLAMNDGVTVCINVLRSVFNHFQVAKRIRLGTLSNTELIEAITPWAKIVGQYFSSLTPDQMKQFRALRGVQGQTTGTRRLEEAIKKIHVDFSPPGLEDFLKREKAQTTARASEKILAIEQVLKTNVLRELKSEFGPREEDWWFASVPKSVRKKVDDRRNEEAGKSGGREDNFDFIDYREIIEENWSLFEPTLSRGKGSKDKRTKWIVEVNELRKRVMHASKGQSLPITEEELASLEDIQNWLEGQVGSKEDV